MARRLKLMTDYECSPLWDYGESGDLYDNPDPASLPLSKTTIDDLKAWAAWYDTWVDMREPYDSRRVLPEEREAFKRVGRRLWESLQRELGSGWHVVYFEDGKVLEPAG